MKMSQLVSSTVLPKTDGVVCFRFSCGHETILGRADARTYPRECIQCKHEALRAYGLVPVRP